MLNLNQFFYKVLKYIIMPTHIKAVIINYQQLNTIYPILIVKCKPVKYSVVLKEV